MNAMAAALSPMTPPQPGPQNGRGDEARGGEFARCLGQACEGESPEPPERSRASEAPQRPSAKAGSGRDATSSRKADASTAQEAPSEKNSAADAAADSESAATEPVEALYDEAVAPDLAALLPGWSPPTVAVASTTSNAAAAADGTDVLQAAAAASGATPISSTPADYAIPRAAVPLETQPLRGAASTTDSAASTAAPSSAQLQAATSEKRDTAHDSPAAGTPAAAGLAFAAQSTTAATAAKTAEPTLPTATVQAPIGTPTFAPSLATQVRWWATDGVQQAQLMLNPAEMGPVAVRIVLDGREARIDFSADLAATRGAIEAALPALAAALDDSGLKLSGGGVHDGSAQRQAAWGAQDVTHRTVANASARDDERSTDAAATRNGPVRGMVDLVA